MTELTQVIADSMYNFFIAFETLLDTLDNIIIFDFSLYVWTIVFVVANWFFWLIMDLFDISTENTIEIEEVFTDD
jgi:hypothetical protein